MQVPIHCLFSARDRAIGLGSGVIHVCKKSNHEGSLEAMRDLLIKKCTTQARDIGVATNMYTAVTRGVARWLSG